jgi:DNA-directed RNA polymerase subunit beta
MLLRQTATAAPKGAKKGAAIDAAMLDSVEPHEWWKFAVKDDKVHGRARGGARPV